MTPRDPVRPTRRPGGPRSSRTGPAAWIHVRTAGAAEVAPLAPFLLERTSAAVRQEDRVCPVGGGRLAVLVELRNGPAKDQAVLAKLTAAPVTILATLLTGGLVGLLNGSMIAGFRMMPFVVTLGMMGVTRGAAKWLADNQTVNFDGESMVTRVMEKVSPDTFFPLPSGVWIALLLTLLMSVFMRCTVFGRYVFAIGSNEATARLCGIAVRPYKVLIYSIAGLFFGLAGLMQLSRLSQGDPSVAIGLELDIIAAVVIGGASLNGGSGSVIGAVVGALVMAVLRSGSSQMNWPNYVQEIIIGIVIILAVGLDRFRQSQAAR